MMQKEKVNWLFHRVGLGLEHAELTYSDKEEEEEEE